MAHNELAHEQQIILRPPANWGRLN